MFDFIKGIISMFMWTVFLSALLLFGALRSCEGKATGTHVLTYQELVDYPSSCAKADEQLTELRNIQKIKNFAQDPDVLNDEDRAYNSRLKASIWWYAYRCGKS